MLFFFFLYPVHNPISAYLFGVIGLGGAGGLSWKRKDEVFFFSGRGALGIAQQIDHKQRDRNKTPT